MIKQVLACLLVISASGCPDVDTDPGEGPADLPSIDGPTVEFDPANAIIPFPNNLLIDPTTGKVNIPTPACETAAAMALRVGTLNKLDGFGTFEAAQVVTFTEPVDETTLAGHVVMYQRAKGATDNDPATAQMVPLQLAKTTTLRFDNTNCAMPKVVDAVTAIPLVPLDQKSTYTVAVLAGVKTATGKDYLPSTTFALIRGAEDPVTLDASGNVVSEKTPLDPAGDANHNGIPDLVELQGLDLLWKAHAKALAFLEGTGNARKSVLLAWEVTTQTTTDQLDPTVAGSPASATSTDAPRLVQSITCQLDATTCPLGYDIAAVPYSSCQVTDTRTTCFLKIALGTAKCAGACASAAQLYGTGNAVCAAVGCAAVGDVLFGLLDVTEYQVPVPNALPSGLPIPGPWSDPIHPASQGPGALQVLAFIPAAASDGRTVVFGHGLGSSKSALFAFAPQLAAAGFNSVAIDFVAHGSRAIQTSVDAAIGCSGTPDPTVSPQCFAPIFSADLAATRDNIRESILDLQREVAGVKSCGLTGCPVITTGGAEKLIVDPAQIVYAGQSLGGIIGSTTAAVDANIQSSLLDVPGVGWLDILENTQTLEISCGLVDNLIDAGILIGDKWNGSTTSPTGLCATNAWQQQPGYQQFRVVARWVIDPADGANFTKMLAARKFLIQEVVGDMVVPNISTEHEGALTGLMPMAADPAGQPGACTPYPACLATFVPSASAAVTTNPTTNKWIQYTTLPGDSGTGFPGNTFEHASLLRPAAGPGGGLGTERLQVDGITYLVLNR